MSAAAAPLLVVSGPPGAGKSTVARILAERAERSALVAGDAFYAFLVNGVTAPWLPESHDQNTAVTRAAAATAGTLASGGIATIFDGVVGPWFLPEFAHATGLPQLDYVVLLPPVDVCVHRVRTRGNHGFTDEPATRHMHAEFEGAVVRERHVIRGATADASAVADRIEAERSAGTLTVLVRDPVV